MRATLDEISQCVRLKLYNESQFPKSHSQEPNGYIVQHPSSHKAGFPLGNSSTAFNFSYLVIAIMKSYIPLIGPKILADLFLECTYAYKKIMMCACFLYKNIIGKLEF